MINYITTNNAAKVEKDQAQYTLMCYDHGGIVDDLIIYNRGDRFLMVVNAANVNKDFNWVMQHKIDGVEIENISDQITQVAVQGKHAAATLQRLTDVDLSEIKFYRFTEGRLGGIEMIISHTGYTGEPGFELYFDSAHSAEIWDQILEAGREYAIAPVGLGARDSLRLEKKLCLYGNDIDQDTNPYEAGLGWIVKLDKGDFVGHDALAKIKEEGIKRKLIGFEVEGRMIPRHGYPIKNDGAEIGHVTSGAYSPIIEKNIGLGYVAKEYKEIGTEIEVEARNKSIPATVVKTPFV